MNEERLNKLINDFNPKNLTLFLRDKCINYAEAPQSFPQYDGDKFSDFQKIGEIKFENSDRLVVVTAKVCSDLSERSGKKAQYDKAKKILKELAVYNAGFFIFYDNDGNFRFSLVYAQYEGTKVNFNNFRRFTYFVDTQQTNNTFKLRVGGCDFSTLEKIKDAFSVEKVNKEFYNHIARFFYRLIGGNVSKREMTLPSVNEEDKQTYQEFAVRLIGRTIFCWFLKHKKSAITNKSLIPEFILSSDAVKKNPHYYHIILERLFFEVLNTQPENRSKDILPGADDIPFLNGGLFEPHKKDDFYNGEPLFNLVIPDDWFERFFEILEQYNFTIDENSTVDADVSVDPEMLGRIFENLLAEVNPDTGETARKSTGSYYTPRIIVDYMVDQSLKQYLISKTVIDEDRLNALFSYEAEDILLSESEKASIISALDEIKIIDPACGSGAFPMGILHKMLLVLQKVDPDLKLWLKNHLGNIEPGLFKDKLLERIKNENWEYIRKLLIIQHSIYGVDIQPIAVEISKLRFFLSLVVEEQIDDQKYNRGIEALPNLEFKFVAANSLISLPSAINRQIGFGGGEEINHLKELRDRYLRSYGAEKEQIKEDFLKTRGKLIEHNINWGGKDVLALQLGNWNPFSNDKSDWFDPDWMFGEDSFDIVIANPPYIRIHKQEKDSAHKELMKKLFISAYKDYDIYVLFIEKGMSLLKQNGVLAYITPDKYLVREYGEKIRKLLLEYSIVELFDISRADDIFTAAVYPLISLIKKNQLYGEIRVKFAQTIKNLSSNFTETTLSKETCIERNLIELTEPAYITILDKIYSNSIYLEEVLEDEQIFCGTPRAKDYYEWTKYITNTPTSLDILPVLVCANLKPYTIDYHKKIRTVGISIVNGYFDRKDKTIPDFRWNNFKFKPKILIRGNDTRITAVLDDKGSVFIGIYGIKIFGKIQNSYKYLLATLNSNLFQWIFFTQNPSIKIAGGYFSINSPHILRLPFKPVSSTQNKQFNVLVDQILDITKDADYLSNPAKQAKVKELEHEIDILVYDLYDLTPEEIAIVEGNRK